MLTSLYRKLHEYQNFKNECLNLVANLKKAVNPLTLADRNFSNNYLYNDTRADYGKISKSKNKLNEIINELESLIIPEVDRSIRRINEEIKREEAKEAMEEII